MMLFLIGLILSAIMVIVGIIFYQHKHVRLYKNENGDLTNTHHDPLSQENIHKMNSTLHHFVKEEIKTLLLFILRFLIKVRKVSRSLLDRSISKIAHIIFKDAPHSGPIEENNLLYHMEEQKKTGEKGQIHL
jgi:hypothetical protein